MFWLFKCKKHNWALYKIKNHSSNHTTRYEWLDEFIQYSKLKKESSKERNDANYTENARSQMFIWWQSYERLQIIVLSFKEICKFLLEHGDPYILSERFSQDDEENYFARQRANGRRCGNPTVRHFGYNDKTIKLQYSVRPIAGNVRGPASRFNEITEPWPKKKQ